MSDTQNIKPWLIIALTSCAAPCALLMVLAATQVSAENTELDTGTRVLPYNGYLNRDGGSFSGQVDLQFTLTGEFIGDAPECALTEGHDDVEVFGGQFSVNLGQLSGGLAPCFFDANRVALTMAVREATSDGDFLPLAGQQRINPAPFAYWAAEGSDMKIDGDLSVLGPHARIGGELEENPPTGRPRLEIPGRVAEDGALDSYADYQVLFNRGEQPATSVGMGEQASTGVFYNSPNGYLLHTDSPLMTLNPSASTLRSSLNAIGVILSDGLTVDGASTISGNLTGTSATVNNLTVRGNLDSAADLFTINYYSINGETSSMLQPVNDRTICHLSGQRDGGCAVTIEGDNYKLTGSNGIQVKCTASCLSW